MNFKDFTLLCVEDDSFVRNIYKELFELMFKKVYFAEDGKEGLEIFKSNDVDIILTDEMMPKMNGLDMIEEIRKIDADIPVILVTAFDNKDILERAINLNVTSFVKKPIKKESLIDALKKAVKVVLTKKLVFKELEDKIKYKNYQEKLAYEKEREIIKVDTNIIDGFKVDIKYSPLDITSGDSFSIRRSCIFLVDAMGKGLSASITAMLSTACFNNLVDRGKYFEEVIDGLIEFIKKNLLEYEVLSCGFYHFKENELYYATFSMPAFLIERDGKVEKIKSNNSPISVFNNNFRYDKISLENVNKVLIYTDGLSEAETEDNSLYLKYLADDFLASNTLEEFEEKRKEKVKKQSDDMTYFFLRRINNSKC